MSTSIRAHFDGQVFVPDEPVGFAAGIAVVVTPQQVAPVTAIDFLQPVLFPTDSAASQRFLDDAETGLENY